MLSNFFVALGAVVPIFVLIGIGLIVRHAKLLTDIELKHMNRMVFKVFFFCMLFSNIYRADFADAYDPALMVFGFLSISLLFVFSTIFAIFFDHDNRRRGAMAQAIARSNFVILGIPIVVNIFGDDGAIYPSMMIAVIIPIYNVASVLILETFRGHGFSLLPIITRIAKNPMIDGMIAGALCRLLPFPIPDPILKPLMQVGAATTPIALIILGASFTMGGEAKAPAERRDLAACIIGRLLVAPAIILTMAGLLGFRGAEFVTLIAITTTPCAVASFTMAQQMDSDAVLAGNAVVISSALSCFTMFGWIFGAKMLGLF